MSDSGERANLDNRSNQCNPNHEEYSGHVRQYTGEGTQADLDNHANQKNPNNERCQPKDEK